ncbi:amidohydrolase [Flavobacteriaceae bacterium]|nr:amidohydrolase [Flavobacteriaceae bacterium]
MKSIFKAMLLLLIGATSCTNHNADLIIHNARIYTVNDSFELASTLVVKDGKFIAVGNEDLLEKYSAAAKLDLKGIPVYPGLIDAHCHFYQLGLAQEHVDLRGAKSVEEVIARLKAFTSTSEAKVLMGRGWDQNLWELKEFPSKEILDKAFPDKLVVLERIDGHAAYVNSNVLTAAKITKDTKVEGGEVIIANNEPTGILIDKASDLAYAILPEPSREEQIIALQKAEKIAFANGLTTVDDAGLNRAQLELIDSLQRLNKLKIRVYGMISNTPENLAYYLDKGITQTDRLTIRSVKVYADGALGSRGAALKKPYTDEKKNKGLFITSPEKIEELAYILAKKGFQMNTHAIGDAANEVVLNAYKKALSISPDPRWRIEHAQVVDKVDLQKFGSKILPSVQPTHATSDMEWADERLGEKRVANAYTYKELLDWSGRIALGTDFPVERVNPIHTYYAAVVRKDLNGNPAGGYQMDNALSRSEALKGMTKWAAYANFEEDEKGSIEVGKVADFVLLTNDIMVLNDSEILATEVLATFLGGEMVYQRKQ